MKKQLIGNAKYELSIDRYLSGNVHLNVEINTIEEIPAPCTTRANSSNCLEKHPDERWNWYDISRNPNITIEYVESHPDKRWHWYMISMNPSITMEYIEAHRDKPWDCLRMSRNPNLTMEYVDMHSEKLWNWREIS